MSPRLRASVRRVLLLAGTYGMLSANTATAAPQEASNEITEIVIVTGSYIRGTAEDAALPVDVISADDLAKQGSPSMVDIVKSIPAVQGVFGESNQFGAAQNTGVGNINLRGLGSARTLVLLNGRRLAPSPGAGVGVDTNLLPVAAIGRIEVLKDGAAATYGSDAIGGVVNFITREDFAGLAVDGSYSYIDGSDGDYSTNIAYGWQGESSSAMIAAGYRHRSELSTLERDWAVRDFDVNPQGGWSSFGNPGVYLGGGTARFRDPACSTLGGIETGTAAAPGCQFQYIVFDNLVEKEEHYQVYAEYNRDIGDSTSFHFEALYAAHDVPEENSSPSYAPNQGPSGGSPTYIIPINNPGVIDMLPRLSAAQQAAITATNFVATNGLFWRPLAAGGNPLTGEGKQDERFFDAFRFSGGFAGEFGSSGVSWDVAATYMENNSEISTPDMLAGRLQLALRGLGGPDCATATPGTNGCLWFNPFSSSIAGNPATGQVNNLTYNPALENSAEVLNWMFVDNSYEATTTLFVVDAVLSGESGIELPGGNIGWAFGSQYRDNGYERVVSDFANIDVNPCPQTPITGDRSCVAAGTANGALTFFGPLSNTDVSADVIAAFAEVNLPLLDSVQAQIALRHEEHGGEVGSTTNPKLAVRWQIIDEFAVRGSVGTTFRAPPQTSLDEGYVTTLQFTTAASGYKPYDTYGNPNLKPETADTFNVGFITKVGGFTATVDYWDFKFEDVLTAEAGTALVAAFFGSSPTSPNRCSADPSNPYWTLQQRFTFTGGVGDPGTCSIGNLLRTRANNINGAAIDVSGIDASLYFQFDDVLGGGLLLGLDGTYNLEYAAEAIIVDNVQIEEAGDRIGTRGTSSGTLPQWKATAFLEFAAGGHNVRWTSRYVDGVTDGVSVARATTFATNTRGKEVDAFLTHDLTYRVSLPWDSTLSASVFNVFDEDPSFARLDLSYDPFIANPLGRYFKLTMAKQF